MSTKKAWLSEEEMYKVLEENELFYDFLEDYGFENGILLSFLKQPLVSECGKRPDYILCVQEGNAKYIFIVEVKITADLATLAQLQKYHNHINSMYCVRPGLPEGIEIKKIIFARFFDKSLQPFIDNWIHQEFNFYHLDLLRTDDARPNNKEWKLVSIDHEPIKSLQSLQNQFNEIFGGEDESKQMV